MRGRNAPGDHGIPLKRYMMFPDGHFETGTIVQTLGCSPVAPPSNTFQQAATRPTRGRRAPKSEKVGQEMLA